MLHPSFLCTPCWQSMGKWEVLDSGQALLSNSPNIPVLSTLFPTKAKAQQWTSTQCWTKKKLIPSQTKPEQHVQIKILFMFFFMFFTFCILVVTDEKDFPDYLPVVTLQALRRPSAIPLYWLFLYFPNSSRLNLLWKAIILQPSLPSLLLTVA